MKLAFLYPGQGAQTVGMGKDIYAAFPAVKTYLNKVLDSELLTVAFEGPLEELSKTEHTQPALLAMEIAFTQLLADAGIEPHFAAGLSLGEYAALVAAGILDPEEAVALVKVRGQLMATALPAGTTAMAAVIGMDVQTLQALLELVDGTVEIANYNCPKQVVIGGEKAAVNEATRLIKDAGYRKVIPLKTSGAFHTSLLQETAQQFKAVLEKTTIKAGHLPVVFNKTAQFQNASIVELMTDQLRCPVKFEDSIRLLLKEGVDTFVEIGPGQVLAGFIKRIDRHAQVYHVSDLTSLNETIEELKKHG